MLGETDANWRSCVEKTIEMAPDSVTIYQMELPFNTTISRNLLRRRRQRSSGVANWSTKRRWVDEAFEALEAAGYTIGSAYTAVKSPSTKFVYRDRLWQGADMVGLGRRVVRLRQRRAHAEPRLVRGLLRSDPVGHAAARPRAAADRRGASHPRVRPAAEARARSGRRTSSASTGRTCCRRSGAGLDGRSSRRAASRSRRTESPSRARACCAWTACCRASSSPSTPRTLYVRGLKIED